ncbi:MAG: hypothetical protein AAGM38_15965 [Pseudomonadota bacterium]
MSKNDRAEGGEARAGGAARLSGAHALGAAGATLFAPFSATLLTLNGAPTATAAITALAAAPLAATCAAAAGGGASSRAVALATIPVALGATWTAWITGGPASPAIAWIFASAVAIALFWGRFGALLAASLALGAAAFLIAAPDPALSYAPFRPIEERELLAIGSWSAAMLAVCAAAWAAVGAWRDALPPLRHPTILAREALGRVAEDAAVCALRIGSKGVIIQAVGGVERALDLPRDQIKGAPIEDILHPDDAGPTRERLNVARMAGGGDAAPDRLTLRVRSRLGGYRWVEAFAADAAGFPASPGGADPGGALLVLRERWRPLQEDLTPADPARSAFLAQMNASLKDDLTEVVGYAEIMKSELFGPLGGERYREYARLAHDSGARLLERMEELLDLASLEAGAPLATEDLADATPLIDGAVRVARAKAETIGVQVKADIAADAPHVRIDRRALRRVLVALLLDSVRRTQIGDGVRLTAEAEDGAMRFAVLAEPRERADDAEPAGGAVSETDAASGGLRETGGAARFGRLVAETLVERLGGAIAFYDDAGAETGATLCDVLLPVTPPTAMESAETRPRPIPHLKPRPEKADAGAEHSGGRDRDAKARRAGLALIGAFPGLSAARRPAAPRPAPKTPALVAAPTYTVADEDDADPLSAERQTEMALQFEEDLQRERRGKAPSADPGDNAASTAANGRPKTADEVELPLFEPAAAQRSAEGGAE